MALAVVRYNNNRIQFVPAERAANIWRAKHGFARYLSKAQRAYIRRVREVYMSPSIAPPEYREAHAKREAEQGSQLELDQQPTYWWQRYDNIA